MTTVDGKLQMTDCRFTPRPPERPGANAGGLRYLQFPVFGFQISWFGG
jgi:hypothetical protein